MPRTSMTHPFAYDHLMKNSLILEFHRDNLISNNLSLSCSSDVLHTHKEMGTNRFIAILQPKKVIERERHLRYREGASTWAGTKNKEHTSNIVRCAFLGF